MVYLGLLAISVFFLSSWSGYDELAPTLVAAATDVLVWFCFSFSIVASDFWALANDSVVGLDSLADAGAVCTWAEVPFAAAAGAASLAADGAGADDGSGLGLLVCMLLLPPFAPPLVAVFSWTVGCWRVSASPGVGGFCSSGGSAGDETAILQVQIIKNWAGASVPCLPSDEIFCDCWEVGSDM